MYFFPNLEPVHWSMSGSNCCFLTCIQGSQGAGKVVWYFYLFKNFPQFVMIHMVKGFSIVNEDIFLEYSCFFYDSTDVGNLISDSSTFSKSSLNIWRFSVHILLSLAWRILRITLLACEASQASLTQSLVGSPLLCPVSFAQKVLFVPFKSLFTQSCECSVIKSHWSSKSNSLGFLSPFARSQGWEICCGP